MKSITELQVEAKKIDAQHYELQLWSNGVYFVRATDAAGHTATERVALVR